MDIENEMLKLKGKEILCNLKNSSNSNQDDIVKYIIYYANGSMTTYQDSFKNGSFSSKKFIKRMLYDIHYDNNIKLVKVMINNNKYKEYESCSNFCEQFDMSGDLVSTVNKIEKQISYYHLFSTNEFLKQDLFTDKDYKLVNTIVDIINSCESIKYGYIINYKCLNRKLTTHQKYRAILFHQLCSLYSINNDLRKVQISNNVYKSINFQNKSSKNYVIQSYKDEPYLKDYSFFLSSRQYLLSFPYLVDYILELMNWKYKNNQQNIPDNVYDEISQEYINGSSKVKKLI